MKILCIFSFLIFYIISFSQTTIRIGRGANDCGTMQNPCPTALCTMSSTNETPRTISVASGSRINFSFNQAGGCGGSTGYLFESGETLTLTWPAGNSAILFSGDGASEATGSGCYFNNSVSPITLSFQVNLGSARRDEAVIFTYTISSGDASCIPLPVKISKFEIKNNKSTSFISFTTASETNNDYFTIERSGDGSDFDAIGEIDGDGNSSEERHYEFTDRNPLPGINYYRIKQTDYDGQYSYSEIRSVRHDGAEKIAVSPRHTDGRLDIMTEMDSYEVAIYCSAGQEVSRFSALSGHQSVGIESLQSGIYFVKVVSGATSETVKIVKY